MPPAVTPGSTQAEGADGTRTVPRPRGSLPTRQTPGLRPKLWGWVPARVSPWGLWSGGCGEHGIAFFLAFLFPLCLAIPAVQSQTVAFKGAVFFSAALTHFLSHRRRLQQLEELKKAPPSLRGVHAGGQEQLPCALLRSAAQTPSLGSGCACAPLPYTHSLLGSSKPTLISAHVPLLAFIVGFELLGSHSG